MNRNRPQMRPQFVPKVDLNYGQQNSYGNKSNGPIVNKVNNYYRRTQHPYFGQKADVTGSQYRAQVIDYSGPQSQPINEPIPRMPSNRFPNNSHHFRYYMIWKMVLI